MHPTTRDLAFLLSIGSLPAACFKDEGQGSDGTVDATGTTGVTGETGATGGSSTGGEETVATTFLTGQSTGEAETEGAITDPQCAAFANRLLECYSDRPEVYAYYAAYCVMAKVQGMELDGRSCAAAFEAYFVCLAHTECEEFTKPGGPCDDAQEATESACPKYYEKQEEDEDDETTTGGTGDPTMP